MIREQWRLLTAPDLFRIEGNHTFELFVFSQTSASIADLQRQGNATCDRAPGLNLMDVAPQAHLSTRTVLKLMEEFASG